jgi:hypothetical protein
MGTVATRFLVGRGRCIRSSWFDEIGYMSVNRDGAVLFFQLINVVARCSDVDGWLIGDGSKPTQIPVFHTIPD